MGKHSYLQFTGTEKFCENMKDDLINFAGKTLIRGERVVRPRPDAQRLADLAKRVSATLKRNKSNQACDIWRTKTFATEILGNPWASDNERAIATQFFTTYGD